MQVLGQREEPGAQGRGTLIGRGTAQGLVGGGGSSRVSPQSPGAAQLRPHCIYFSCVVMYGLWP